MMCSRKLNLLTPCRAGIEIFILELKEGVVVMTYSTLRFLCFFVKVGEWKKEGNN